MKNVIHILGASGSGTTTLSKKYLDGADKLDETKKLYRQTPIQFYFTYY